MSWLSDATGINIDVAGALGHIRDDIGSILQGGNVFQNLGNIATTIIGTSELVAYPLLASSQAKAILNNPTLNALSLGISSNFASAGNVLSDLSSGTEVNNLQTKDVQGVLQLGAKAAAILVGAEFLDAPTTVTEGLQTYGAAKTVDTAAAKGNIIGALAGATSTLVGGEDIISGVDVNDALSLAQNALQVANAANAQKPSTRQTPTGKTLTAVPGGLPSTTITAGTPPPPTQVALFTGLGLLVMVIFMRRA